MKLTYILGLGHSGSTFLQLILSRHPNLVGLGEIAMLIDKLKKGTSTADMPLCSCGEKVENCEFWGEILPQIPNNDSVNSYHQVLKLAAEKYPQKTFVDASKTLKGFKTYFTENIPENTRLKVIFLVRDFRSWLLSVHKTRLRKNRNIRGAIFEGYRWLIHNLKIYFFLKKHKISYQIVIYEDLVFQHEKSLKAILGYLGETDFSLNPVSEAHDIYGNRMKNQASKKTGLYYDHSWMQKSRGFWMNLIFVPQYKLMNFLYKKVNT